MSRSNQMTGFDVGYLNLDILEPYLRLDAQRSNPRLAHIPEPWVLRGQLLRAFQKFPDRLMSDEFQRVTERRDAGTYRARVVSRYQGVRDFFPSAAELEPWFESVRERVRVIRHNLGVPDTYVDVDSSDMMYNGYSDLIRSHLSEMDETVTHHAMKCFLRLEGTDPAGLHPGLRITYARDAGIQNAAPTDFAIRSFLSLSPESASVEYLRHTGTFSLDVVARACDPADPTCSVCQEDYDNSHRPVRTILCKHNFGAECLKGWIDRLGWSVTCLMCRQLLEPQPRPDLDAEFDGVICYI
ncbi:uncharacterized protein BDZ99DRAFT_555985 [Mytilinidion resinicola]|uniref:RING-type domain-containing protein n=1 Tax=Mytilinidion resinicola TaxID=574789 RepID=A0A6A6YVG2_9PEZI|nr:uncharacterized protein BDZ99DRAFT_555985 [Mytilinidion resinicola]KAF2812932.1 hypothetical protein BDZ99DRAFT_555985 [Mytilinidion resinicola]